MSSSTPLPPHHEHLRDYSLSDKLGQGAFGSVYKAFNWTTGETVAVKQIGLSNIPKSELPDIMSEIDLLKNLHHPNIVQYRGFVKTADSLFIILEYCENGSLHAITKKFGRFPESLVSLYILQVLQGLLYLHDQGVIHRDIKGSNILATKEGSIKLADFGVATKAGGPADSAVVGSPYWMAPEVVEQSGATTASDIWSLGALVIELLTGKPPYHFLDPMPALFRIVNDDCPPIPETASAIARDFLLQCFQKDGNLRVSARKLLRHPWMMAAKRQVEVGAAAGSGGRRGTGATRGEVKGGEKEGNPYGKGGKNDGGGVKRPNSGYEDTVQRVQEWNEALKTTPNSSRPRISDENHRILRRPSAELASALQKAQLPLPTTMAAGINSMSKIDPARPASALPLSLMQPNIVPTHPGRGPKSSLAPIPLAATSTALTVDEEGEDDNWDSDFEEGISISKLAALDRDSSGSGGGTSGGEGDGVGYEDEDEEANSDTISPSNMSSPAVSAIPMDPIVEDYSDLLGEGDADPFEGKVASLREFNSSQKRILHPKDISESFVTNSPSSSVNILRPPAPRLLPTPLGLPPRSSIPMQRSTSLPAESSTASARSSMDKYSEADSEDYSDVFGKQVIDAPETPLSSLHLHTRLSSKSWLGDEDSDEEDPFAEVEEAGADETDLETNIARDKLARMCAYVGELIDTISSESDDFSLREASLELITVLEDTPEVKSHFLKSHGMLSLIEVLQVTKSRDVIAILLRVVNLIIGSDPETLEKICLVGGCPVVMSFASNKYSREIRLEAALFIGAMCRTSLLTLQMFVSCRGLKTLVEMMDENYTERKDLVWMAVDGISRVFDLQGPTPRNDFCRIFTQEGLLDPLSSALLHVAQDEDGLALSAENKIVQIFLTFAQSDHKVKATLASRAIVLKLVRALGILQSDHMAVLLKVFKNLTMLPASLEVLQNANTIEVLVGILSQEFEGKLAAEIQNHVVNSLFNLCRLSKNRQEEAAIAGAIPLLQRVVQGSSPLKQFALPVLCDFAHASKTCRKLLWQHNGLNFYLGLLRDPFWANPSLEAILAWLQDESARVEECLLEPVAFEALLRVFCRTKTATFENLLEPFHKLLRTASTVSARLAIQPSFFKRIIDRLVRGGKAVVRLNLLRTTKTVFESVSERRDKVLRIPNLVATVRRLAQEDPAILVRELAKDLVKEFARTREQAGRASTQSLVSRVMRRATSDSATPGAGGVSRASSLVRRGGTLFGRAPS